MPRAATLLVPVMLGLAACNQTTSGPAAPGVVPSSAQVPAGDACATAIAEFQSILKNDVDIGRLAPAVYGRASADTKQAETVCAAGREVQARTILAITKKNYGYAN